jgi:uncharacterized protein (DUF111 family)
MNIDGIGYGAGTKDFEGFANVLKIVKGDMISKYEQDSVHILETNIDDVSGEIMGNLIEKVMAHGAKDITISHAIGKKGRPTNLVTVICDTESVTSLSKLLIEETGTLGIRVRTSDRILVPRENSTANITIHGINFLVHYKIAKTTKNFKIEYDDIQHISHQINQSFKKTEALLRAEIQKILGTYNK